MNWTGLHTLRRVPWEMSGAAVEVSDEPKGMSVAEAFWSFRVLDIIFVGGGEAGHFQS
jgi:hypothetical protein